MSSRDWTRKVAGVQWPDVWKWADVIRDEYGLWTDVTLAPPLPCQKGRKYGVLSVRLTRYIDGREVEQVVGWRELPPPSTCSAEGVALQLLVKMHQELDRAAWEAERATLEQGGMF